MRVHVASLSIGAILASSMLLMGLGTLPHALAVTPSGSANYFTVSGGSCTSTVFPTALSDGNVPGMFPNNLGGPPMTAVAGIGQICIQVVLSGATANTVYTVTASKLSGTLTLTTDGSGNAIGEAVFASSFSGPCTTNPHKMSPDTPFKLNGHQINHVWVGTGCTSTGVPEFPMGIGLTLAFAIPALLLLRKRATLFA